MNIITTILILVCLAVAAGTGYFFGASKVDELNGLMQSIRRELHFSIDSDSGRTVIKVVDAETQEIVRQIPSEEASTIVDSLGSGSGGLTRGFKA